MKLTELNPRWFTCTIAGNKMFGISFQCPHCRDSKIRIGVITSHDNPHVVNVGYDEEITHLPRERQVWKITGDAPSFDGENHGGFENVSLTPSVDASASGHWHGFITNGEVT